MLSFFFSEEASFESWLEHFLSDSPDKFSESLLHSKVPLSIVRCNDDPSWRGPASQIRNRLCPPQKVDHLLRPRAGPAQAAQRTAPARQVVLSIIVGSLRKTSSAQRSARSASSRLIPAETCLQTRGRRTRGGCCDSSGR